MDDGGQAKNRNFVTALARGLDVLRAFRPGEGALTNTDFAQRTGLPKPTVSRLTYTLCQLDYLVIDARTGAYRLGPGVLGLGFGVLSGIEIGDRAQSVMSDLCAGPNSYVTCALAERHGLEVVYLVVERSTEDVSLSLSVGAFLPLFHSAMGRAILVAMEESDRQRAFALADADDPGGAGQRCAGFERALAEYNERGFCTGYGDWREDVNGIAVPVLAANTGRVFGLNVGGPSFHVSPADLETIYAPRLIDAANRLSLRP